MPYFWINQRFSPPQKCADNSGITVRITPESVCDLLRNHCAIWSGYCMPRTKLDTWDKDRRFVVSAVLKPKKDSVQLSFLEARKFEYFYFVTNTKRPSEKVVIAYTKCAGSAKNAAMLKMTSKKPSMTCQSDTLYSDPFGPTRPSFS
jgi:hypothetical protein